MGDAEFDDGPQDRDGSGAVGARTEHVSTGKLHGSIFHAGQRGSSGTGGQQLRDFFLDDREKDLYPGWERGTTSRYGKERQR